MDDLAAKTALSPAPHAEEALAEEMLESELDAIDLSPSRIMDNSKVAESPSTHTEDDSKKARVMIVDDSPTILKVVSLILGAHGYATCTARDGLMGIELLKRGQQVDLVLLDFVMPRMNGYQFCRELRASADHRELPVVLMSAKSDKIREQFVQQTGAVDAITKPFDARGLVAVVQSGLTKAQNRTGRKVPQAGEMAAEESPVSEAVPSGLPKKLRERAVTELARRLSSAVMPLLGQLNAEKDPQKREARLREALGRESVDDLLLVLREAASESSHEVLSGDLSIVPLAEVMQMLQMQRQTGVMRVKSGSKALTISVRDGVVDLARLDGRTSDEFWIGRYFVEQGSATIEQVKEARKRASEKKKLIGDEIVESGVASDAAREEALRKQSSDLIYDLLRWTDGRFWFAQEPFSQEAERAKLGLGIAGLLLEGFRRVDEWRLMENTIQWDQVISVDPSALRNIEGKLERFERVVIDAVDGKRTVTQVVEASHLGGFEAVKIIYQFLKSRVLRT